MAQQKFRPSLTIQEINYILDILSLDTREATEKLNDSIKKQLSIFALKARIGAVNASHTSRSERVSIEDALDDSPAARRESAYRLWQSNPYLCTAEQQRLAATYRYENDLMSPEEESAYESS